MVHIFADEEALTCLFLKLFIFFAGEEADKNTDDGEELDKRCIECEKFQFRIQVPL